MLNLPNPLPFAAPLLHENYNGTKDVLPKCMLCTVLFSVRRLISLHVCEFAISIMKSSFSHHAKFPQLTWENDCCTKIFRHCQHKSSLE